MLGREAGGNPAAEWQADSLVLETLTEPAFCVIIMAGFGLAKIIKIMEVAGMSLFNQFAAKSLFGNKSRLGKNRAGVAASGLAARLLGLAVLFSLSSLLAGCGINNIPAYEENAKAKWSQVLSQYKRRAELIPNLVKTVKGFAAHEKDVLLEVTKARARASQTTLALPKDGVPSAEQLQQLQGAQDMLSKALSKLLVVVERYPDLKSSPNFLQLQSALEGTENRIAVARRDYIEAVRQYNTELKTFPGRLWKAALYQNYKPMPTFTIEKEKMAVPEVKF